jgi:predicted kinase
MPKLLMLKGLPASGKSTHAKELAASGWVRTNKDDLRAMLNDSNWSKSNEAAVLRLRDFIVLDALKRGKNVVVDDTNFAPIHEETLKKLAQDNKAGFEVKFFDTPLEECIKRDLKRPNSVGERVIKKMYNDYLKPAPAVYTAPEGAQYAVICDIDGTLAHMTDRSPYDWSRVDEDTVDRVVRSIFNGQLGVRKILLSGRDSVCREATERWLYLNSVDYDDLFMRAEGDNRKDSVVKRELFDEHIRDKYNVLFVLDDRNQVVDMWRDELGLKCFQVAPGDF